MYSKGQRIAIRIVVLALTIVLLCTSSAFALTLYKTLEFGSSGSDVYKLQRALYSLGYYDDDIDGRFGTGTEDAVKAYQESIGLEADGKAGTLTLNALYDSAETTTTTTTSYATATSSSTLEYGDSGERVRLLQEALDDLGYNVGTVDGKFGLLTRAAVIAFQKAQGLTADGLAGTKRWNFSTARRIPQPPRRQVRRPAPRRRARPRVRLFPARSGGAAPATTYSRCRRS